MRAKYNLIKYYIFSIGPCVPNRKIKLNEKKITLRTKKIFFLPGQGVPNRKKKIEKNHHTYKKKLFFLPGPGVPNRKQHRCQIENTFVLGLCVPNVTLYNCFFVCWPTRAKQETLTPQQVNDMPS